MNEKFIEILCNHRYFMQDAEQFMQLAMDKQRESCLEAFKKECRELNADEHYKEPLLELAILNAEVTND
jgi:hypothetical protein